MSTEDLRPRVPRAGEPRPPEPTFYLGGQPYVYHEEELIKAGPDFAEMVLHETYRKMWALWAEMLGGCLSRDEWEQQQTDMLVAMCHLRGLIERQDELLPNGHWRVMN